MLNLIKDLLNLALIKYLRTVASMGTRMLSSRRNHFQREFVERWYLPLNINGKSTAAIIITDGSATFMSTMLMKKLGLEIWLRTTSTGTGYGFMGDARRIVGVLESVPVELATGIVIRLKVLVFEHDKYDAIALGRDMLGKYNVILNPSSDDAGGNLPVGMSINRIRLSVPCIRYKDEVPPYAESISVSPIYELKMFQSPD